MKYNILKCIKLCPIFGSKEGNIAKFCRSPTWQLQLSKMAEDKEIIYTNFEGLAKDSILDKQILFTADIYFQISICYRFNFSRCQPWLQLRNFLQY